MGPIGLQLSQAGANVAEGFAGQAMGMLFGKQQDKRQLKQQKRLNALQIAGQKELADYQQAQQFDMWEKTNYAAQVEQMKKAGLNPGLNYGMSGGGGVTTGGGMATNVTGGTATDPSAAVGMGLQLGMMQAQLELTKAQANKTNTEAEIISGAGKEKTIAETENLKQATQNLKEQQELTHTQNDINKIELRIKNKTMDDVVYNIKWNAEGTYEDLIQKQEQNKITQGTMQNAIRIVEQQYLNMIANKALTEQQTKVGKADVQLKEAQTTATESQRRTQIKTAYEGLEATWQGLTDKNNQEANKLKETEQYNILEGILGSAGAAAVIELIKAKPTTMFKGFMKVK